MADDFCDMGQNCRASLVDCGFHYYGRSIE